MTTRIVAGLTGLAILIPAIVWGGLLAVQVIVFLAGLVCAAEYAAMAFPDDRWISGGWVAGCVAALWATAWAGGEVYITWAVASVLSMGFVTLRPGADLQQAADRLGRIFIGTGWVGLLWFLPLLRGLENGMAWLFLVLAISWLGDTGAYFAGRAFGRTKLYPLVSPKKTWEGVAGGVVAATIGVFVTRAIALHDLTPVHCVLLGVGLCLASVLGDLSESLLKRAFGVKDSGWILPGHGGFLDRIDSVLFVAPLLYAFAAVVMN